MKHAIYSSQNYQLSLQYLKYEKKKKKRLEMFMKYVFLVSKRELILGLHGFHVYLLRLNLILVFNYKNFLGV